MNLKDWADWEAASFQHALHSRVSGAIARGDTQALLSMGVLAVTPILESLETSPSEVYRCLPTILGVDAAKGAEEVQESCQRWVSWGRDVGYLKETHGKLHNTRNT